jgi:hypothetical protein
MNKAEMQLAEERLLNARWRLSNLYYILDKNGHKVLFQPNWAQEELYDNLWYLNIILKSRQLGITTFITLLFLDFALFNSNLSLGIIADTEENAKYIFRKIKFAYDNLPESLKAERESRIDSAKELTFSNNSIIRVGTSLRSATFQFLLISEFGKIAADDIKRANEIVSGSLNTLAQGAFCFIESTAKGRSGAFYDMCIQAKKLKDSGRELSKMDFRFHFLPWWRQPEYRLGSAVTIGDELHNYFFSLEAQGIHLDLEQKYWYCNKKQSQGENMTREFPSTSEEAWMVTNEGLYYSKQMNQCRVEKRVTHVVHDEMSLVHTAWDLGFSDNTAIWFFQIIGKEIHLIDFIQGSGESLAYWISQVNSRPYNYGKHLCPHDILHHELSSGMSRQSTARKLNINLIAVPRISIISGIDQVRAILPKCWFDEKRCAEGLKCLENYKKLWDEKNGCWSSSPHHDFSSHGSDSFRYLAVGLPMITGQLSQVDASREKFESQRDKSGLPVGHYLHDAQGMQDLQNNPFRGNFGSRF